MPVAPIRLPHFRACCAALPRAVRAVPFLLLCAAVLSAALPERVHAAPKSDLWPRWEANDPGNRLHIDHGAWNDVLLRNLIHKHPSGVHRLDYGGFSPTDRLLLDRYVQEMAAVPISAFNRAQQKAYWINLYNALTVQLVVKHRPAKSIREIDISPGLFAFGPWDAKLIEVEGMPLTLNDIEHRILRPIWRDPRVHYAVNCASIGCPNLARDAYTVFNIERQLDEGARSYVNHPRGARFEDGELIVSSIYVWFQEDFGGNEAGVLSHLRQYAQGELAARLAGWQRGFDHAYDWSLNAP